MGHDAKQLAEYDLVFEGVPRKVELIEVGSFSNAVESVPGGLDALEAIVSFRVVKVLKQDSRKAGKRALPRLNPAHLLGSLARGKWKEIVRPNPLKPDEDIRSRWFRIGVKDPYRTFGIILWDNVEPAMHRIYLRYLDDREDTFIMVRSERIDHP